VTESRPSAGLGFSFPLGIPLLLDPLLLVGMVAGRGKVWAYLLHGIYLGGIALFAWQATSRTQYEKIHSSVADLTRANWILNWLIFFVALPFLLWVFFGLRLLMR
jgi:hypothetical protein